MLRFFQGTYIYFKSSRYFKFVLTKVEAPRCLSPVACCFVLSPRVLSGVRFNMEIRKYNQMKRHLTRSAEKKPMDILKYINRMNSIYGNGTDEYGNAESATDRIQEQDKLKKYKKVPSSIDKAIIDRKKPKAPVAEKAPKRIAKKPTVLELLEIEDWLNTIDPNYWIPEEKPKPKPEDKTRIMRTGITKLI